MEDFELPLDLIIEILKKLPAKSLMRFRCISKEWSSIISNSRYFTESIMSRSLRLPLKLPVFIFHCCVPATRFTVSSTFSLRAKPSVLLIGRSSSYHSFKYQYVRGFICCSSSRYDFVMVYNPTTRQCVPLPEIKPMAVYITRSWQLVPSPKIKPMAQIQKRHCYFGYDNVMNQYKVLALVTDSQKLTQTFHVFALGKDCHQWRKIQGNIDEKLFPIGDEAVCIDGTIYYGAIRIKEGEKYDEVMLLSFDVRSERFYHVSAPETLLNAIRNWSDRKPFNHMGKLGWISRNENNASIWIMEDAKKQEWSNVITFGLPQYEEGDFMASSGVTPDGEIFVVKHKTSYPHGMPLYVYYYNMKQKNFRKVEIEGAQLKTTKHNRYSVRVFPIHDYVENTMWL
ncbi:F-box protein [Cardamine amara subsp. amara]|uniref:F-box protein n=1 Tax=Cardamine amara subsp. amara TaxID=228776 RepID=A0ABD1BGG6_CARAN